MITVVIADNEKKAKQLLARFFDKESDTAGPGSLESGQGVQVVRARPEESGMSLKDKIIELEESLSKEKKTRIYRRILDLIEQPLLEHILRRTEGNQLKAARILGINRNTMRAKIKRLGINIKQWKTES